ncbi:hypothetical protein Ae717Ps2_6948 [Pseudonocardia sp. Ae717_Ps2]|nr:hypothetical protein Ae717Ps2_6948 [Pseudonocardia sp. Ae717_Ps2]
MLHGQSARDHLEEHQLAPPGVALVQAPARPLGRVRGPRLMGPSEDADYARYWDEIADGRGAPPRGSGLIRPELATRSTQK